MSKRITTTSNFDFIQRNFIQAKKGLNKVNALTLKREEEDDLVIKAQIQSQIDILNIERLKGIGLEGASRTGKSWDICVFLCHYITTYRGKEINICRDHLTTLKKTFYSTLKKVWIKEFKLPSYHFNKSATDIIYNDNIIRFVGVNDDIMTAHGLESDLLIGNEFMGVAKDTADHLEQRTTEFFIFDYNPSAVESYLFDMEKRGDYACHHTTIFDNPYAPHNSKQKILSYAHEKCDDYAIAKKAGYSVEQWDTLKAKNHALGTADKFKWEVYGLGLRSVSEDVIFPNWEMYTEDPKGYDWRGYGGDFGFKTDPTTFIEVTRDGNNLYLKENIWENGLLNNEIADRVISGGWDDERSVWDSSEYKSINELRSYGVPADWAEKPPNSVAYGIQRLHQFNIFIHYLSVNLQDEFRKYRWAKDRQGNFKRNTFGKKVPVDKHNHGIDAVRYKVSYHFDILEQENEN